MFANFLSGFSAILQPLTFLFMVFGVVVGIIIGALPGLSGSMGIILLLPLVYRLPADTALVMLCGLFCGSMYGGSISAILLKTPGTPSAAATVLDGYPLCEQGQAGRALGISTIASFIGGLFSSICLFLIAPQLAKIALNFHAADYFSLAIFGLSIMASSSGKNIGKGLLAGCLGLLISTVGIDAIAGTDRFTFGIPRLMRGFNLLPVLIGVFALSEVFSQVANKHGKSTANAQVITNMLPKWFDIKGFLIAAIVGSVIGVFVGIIPGTGGSIASFIAYNVAQKLSKRPDKFGKGSYEGVAAPEASNNATTGGALIPMLCLGVPGDVVTSVMLGSLILIGVRPGPLLFVESIDLVYTIFAGMFAIQFVMLAAGLLSAKYSPKILKIPTNILMPIIIILCVVGSYSLGNQLYDVYVAVCFGVIGYFMKKYGYPGAPLVLGVILGPIAEENLNRALLMSKNSLTVFYTRPISLVFLLLAAFTIVFSLVSSMKKAKA